MKKEKMAGLLPEESGQCALRSKMKKPFTKDHSILTSSPPEWDMPPSSSSFSTGHPGLAAKVPRCGSVY